MLVKGEESEHVSTLITEGEERREQCVLVHTLCVFPQRHGCAQTESCKTGAMAPAP